MKRCEDVESDIRAEMKQFTSDEDMTILSFATNIASILGTGVEANA